MTPTQSYGAIAEQGLTQQNTAAALAEPERQPLMDTSHPASHPLEPRVLSTSADLIVGLAWFTLLAGGRVAKLFEGKDCNAWEPCPPDKIPNHVVSSSLFCAAFLIGIGHGASITHRSAHAIPNTPRNSLRAALIQNGHHTLGAISTARLALKMSIFAELALSNTALCSMDILCDKRDFQCQSFLFEQVALPGFLHCGLLCVALGLFTGLDRFLLWRGQQHQQHVENQVPA